MTDNNARGTLINQVGAVFVPVADQDRAEVQQVRPWVRRAGAACGYPE
jgi:hypothetical protein